MYSEDIEFAINWEESQRETKPVKLTDDGRLYEDVNWNEIPIAFEWSEREQVSWTNYRSRDFVFIEDTVQVSRDWYDCTGTIAS